MEYNFVPHNTYIIPFFQDEMGECLNRINDTAYLPFHMTANVNALFEYNFGGAMPFVANGMLGSFIKLNDHFFIPLNGAIVYISNLETNKEIFLDDINTLINSGLVFRGK
jgi:hypothetical protein